MKQFLTSLVLGGALGAAPTPQDYPPWDENDTRPNVHIGMLARLTKYSCGPIEYVAKRMAVHHVNTRNSTLAPAINNLQNPFYLSYDMFDSNGNGLVATRGGLEMLGVTNEFAGVTKEAKVLVGPLSSDTTLKCNPVLGIFGVPQIGWAATNALLSNVEEYPYYFRPVPPDSFAMSEMVKFMATLLPGKSVHILYSDGGYQKAQAMDFVNSWGTTFTQAGDPKINSWKFKPAGEAGMSIKGDATATAEVQNALNEIKVSDTRICVLFVISAEGGDVQDMIVENGMLTKGYLWLGTDGIGAEYIPPQRARLYKGVLAFQALDSSIRSPMFAKHWADEVPTMSLPEFDTFERCGKTMRDKCKDNDDFTWYDRGMTNKGTAREVPSGKLEDESRTKLQCVGYTAFAYDAIISSAIAIDRAITAKGGNAASITGMDIADQFKLMKESDGNMGLSPGKLFFNDEHWRPLPMQVLNFDGLNGAPFRVAEVHAGVTVWCDHLTITDSSAAGYCDGSTDGKGSVVWSDGSVGFANLPSGAPPQVTCEANQVIINDQCDLCPGG